MAVVGDAYVVVRAITNKVRDDIQRSFRDARPAVAQEGRAAGQEYAGGFERGIGGNRMGNAVRNSLSGVESAAGSAGQSSGDAFAGKFMGAASDIDGSSAGRRFGQSFADAATPEAGSVVDDIGSETAAAAGGAGRRAGNAFGQGFLNSNWARSAQQASQQFTMLLGVGNLIGPALSGIISGASAVVSGLFAMGAAASQAAGALAVLPGAISVAAQAMGTMRLAFSGIGDAISAGMEAVPPAVEPAKAAMSGTGDAARSAAQGVKDAMEGVADAQQALARAQQDAARRIADAQQGIRDAQDAAARSAEDARDAVQDAYRDAAEAAVDSARAIADAEQEVRDAQVDVLSVQRELNAARREAAEGLQQLAFDAEDAALAEERAALQLEDAHAKLVAAQALPADDRTRREAELAFKEAELNYRQAKDRNSDLEKEQRRAAKAGVEGSEEVLSVRERINDAQGRLADAEQSLADQREDARRQERDSQESIADAEEALAETQIDNARAIADAEQALADARLQNARAIADAEDAVADARQRLKDAQDALNRAQKVGADVSTAAATATDKYAEALQKLSPEARSFVEYMVSIQDEIQALRNAAGQEMFPKLEQGMRTIVENLFPVLRRQLRVTGGLVGDMGLDFANTVSKGEGLDRIGNILSGNNKIMRIFTREGKDGKSAINELVLVALRLLEAIQPITNRFARWVRHLIDVAEKSTDTKKEMEGLTDFFDRAGDAAAQLGDIFGNLWDTLVNLGIAAGPAGQGLLDSFEKATQKLSEMTEEGRKSGELGKYFKGVANNMRDIGDLAATIGDEFFKLGDNPAIGEFAQSLRPAVRNIGRILEALTDSSPQVGKFLEHITGIGAALAESGATEVFLNTLNKIAGWIERILQNEFVGKALAISGAIFGVTRALSFALVPIKFFFRAFSGGFITLLKFLRFPGRILGAWRVLRGGGGIGRAFAAIRGGSDQAKRALERQIGVDRTKIKTLQGVTAWADRAAGALQRYKGAAAVAGAPVAAPAAAGAAAAVPAAGAAASAAPAAAASASTAAKSAGRFSRLGKVMGAVAKGPLKLLRFAFLGIGRALMAILGPIGIVIAVGYLLYKFFQRLYKQSPEFRKFVDAIVEKLQALKEWFLNVIDKYVIPAMNKFFGWLNDKGPAIAAFFEKTGEVVGNVVGWVVDFVKKHWPIISTIILGPIGNIVRLVIKHWDKISGAFSTGVAIVKKIIGALVKAAQWLWDKLFGHSIFPDMLKAFKNVFGAIGDVIDKAKNFFKGLWDRVKQVATWIGDKLTDLKNWVKERLWTAAKFYIDLVKKIYSGLWNKIKQVFEWIGDKFDDFKTALEKVRNWVGEKVIKIKDFFSGLWDNIKEKIDNAKTKLTDFAQNTLETIKTWIKNKVDDIKGFFTGIPDALATAFGKLANKARGPLNSFIGFMNDKVIGSINKITGKFGLTIPDIPKVPAMQEGGRVTGRGGPTEDNQLRRLSVGEQVIKTKSARAVGYPVLDYINKTGQLPGGSGRPRGGVWGWVKEFAGDAFGGVTDWLKKGVGYALRKVIETAQAAMDAVGLDYQPGKGFTITNFFHGVLDKLADKAAAWGQDKDMPDPRTGSVGAYKGPPGGWTYPLGSRYPAYTFSSHNPSWSVDIGAPRGTPVRAASAGKIATLADLGSTSYGKYIEISHSGGVETLYAHLDRWLVKLGQIVKTGQLIGYSGNTGGVRGSGGGYHLHFELKPSSSTIAAMAARGVRLAEGGIVPATPGGILAMIGEGGRNERVEPLNERGMSRRDEELLRTIRETRGGDTYNVYPTRGMSELELAEMINRRVSFKQRTGT